jgi:hypothetical protein
MGPHRRVHGGGNQHRLVGGEQHGGGEITGEAVRHLRHQVGGGRRHADQVAVARQPYVADILLVLTREQIGVDVTARERADGQRGDEFLRACRHDGPDLGAALAQPADEVERLVGGDAAGDDQQDAFAGKALVSGGAGHGLRHGSCGYGLGGNRRRRGPAGIQRREKQAHLFFHRSAVPGGALAQGLFDGLVDVADGQCRHVRLLGQGDLCLRRQCRHCMHCSQTRILRGRVEVSARVGGRARGAASRYKATTRLIPGCPKVSCGQAALTISTISISKTRSCPASGWLASTVTSCSSRAVMTSATWPP